MTSVKPSIYSPKKPHIWPKRQNLCSITSPPDMIQTEFCLILIRFKDSQEDRFNRAAFTKAVKKPGHSLATLLHFTECNCVSSIVTGLHILFVGVLSVIIYFAGASSALQNNRYMLALNALTCILRDEHNSKKHAHLL